MDWIDHVIRDLCELPDRSSPQDDPEAIVATHGEIRAAIEANMPHGITTLQRQAIGGLFAVADAAYFALEDCEEVAGGPDVEYRIEANHYIDLCAALDALEELPDDKPGYTLSEPARAEWALRDLLTPNAEIVRLDAAGGQSERMEG